MVERTIVTRKAFIARSFDPKDELKIRPILNFLDSFSKSGLECHSAEGADTVGVSAKVRQLIDSSDLFIGFLTRRHPIVPDATSLFGRIKDAFFGGRDGARWTAPPWVLQESGYAIKQGIPMLLLIEEGIESFGLQGDLEYVPFDSDALIPTFQKISEWVNSSNARYADDTRKTEELGAQASPMSEVSPPDSPPLATTSAIDRIGPQSQSEAGEESLGDIYMRLLDALENHRWDAAESLYQAGAALISKGASNQQPIEGVIDNLFWELLYIQGKFRNGVDTFPLLESVVSANPDRYGPLKAIGDQMEILREHEKAIEYWKVALNLAPDKVKPELQVNIGRSLLELERADEAAGEGRAALAMRRDYDPAAELVFDALLKSASGRFEEILAACFLESYLKSKPLSPLRFRLAHKYHERNLFNLAYSHYKIFTEREPRSATGFNNLGVSADMSELRFRSTRAYETSVSLGEPLAASNLAYKYLNVGLNAQAKSLLTESKGIPTTAEEVSSCLAAIAERERGRKTPRRKRSLPRTIQFVHFSVKSG
jgi:tetratricopeptide (TPR) repeat protein